MASIELYQTSSGKTRYRVRHRTPAGRQTDKRGFKTKRDAQLYLHNVEVAKSRGEYIAPALGRTTVGELGTEWLTRQRGHLKPNSWQAIESAWRVNTEPQWARTAVADVTYSEVQAWISDLAQRRGAKTVRSAHGVLFGILEDAVRDRRIASNPARGVKLPPIIKKPNTYLTAQQLIDLARESGRYGSLVLLLGTSGLRWGEVAALRVGDIDFQRRTVLIHQNATGGTTATPKGGAHRTVAIAPFVLDELASIVQAKNNGDLIWPSKAGGYLKPPATHDSWLSGAVKRCQGASAAARSAEIASTGEPTTPVFPRITAHDLRHTAASLSIAAGANVKVIQRMLGHKSAAMTLDVYADLFDDDLTAVADRLDVSVGKMWAKPAHPPASGPVVSRSASTYVLEIIAPPIGLEPITARLTVGSSAN